MPKSTSTAGRRSSAPRPDASRAAKWSRRALTIPGLVLLCAVDLAALPVLLAAAAVVDVVKRRRFAGVRFHLAVAFALGIHVVGLLLLLGAWIAGVLEGRARERALDVEAEAWWATTIWRGAVRLYGMRIEVEGDDALRPGGGPVVVMSRHASLLDTLLPVVFVGRRCGLALRYVAKRELIWDPFFDLAGHRLATAFVRRRGRDHELDVAVVESLARDLGPRDGIVIFPEGTRFTAAKRAKALAALARRDEAAFAHAQRLANLLPPHPRGPLTLLDHARGADVVFSAHTGLEGANHLRDLLAGSLVGATVRVRYWRVPAADVPADGDVRVAWLRSWWEHLDAWVEANRAPPAALDRELARAGDAAPPTASPAHGSLIGRGRRSRWWSPPWFRRDRADPECLRTRTSRRSGC